MEIVLVPGLWLNASTWDRVTPALAAAGHRPTALTLPGMASVDTDRAKITLDDHVAGVVAAIDAADGPVVLVGHSAGCGIAHAAVDARPDRVAHVLHVGGFPSADGELLLTGLESHDGEIAMPDWVEMGEAANVADFDEQQLADFYAAAVPVPEGVLTTPVRLSDEKRFEVPVTMVCPEYRVADLQAWLDDDPTALSELRGLTSVTYVDLPAGHWPQLTRPDDLAQVILDAVPAAEDWRP